MELVDYCEKLLPGMLAVFEKAVSGTKGYSSDEKKAWLSVLDMDKSLWSVRFQTSATVIALSDEEVAGFGNILSSGYVDMLYVSPSFQGRGIGKKILFTLEGYVSCSSNYFSSVSLDAIPFFEHCGYTAVKKQSVIRKGIQISNTLMAKERISCSV